MTILTLGSLAENVLRFLGRNFSIERALVVLGLTIIVATTSLLFTA